MVVDVEDDADWKADWHSWHVYRSSIHHRHSSINVSIPYRYKAPIKRWKTRLIE